MDNIITVANEMIDELRGTCMRDPVALADEYIEEGRMKAEFWEQNEIAIERLVDNEIFNCDTCGWWCEMSEASDSDQGMVCDGCYDEEEQ
jgi:formylmethanofuran dehydrogenase subunit E